MEKPKKALKIDSELHRLIRIRAAETQVTITEIVEAALRLYLDTNSHKQVPPKS